jgi:hypothetical protein
LSQNETMTDVVMKAKKDVCTSRFPIPQSLHDLEHEPYNLLPYPLDFEDDHHNEEVRMNSFDKLVQYIEQGNRYLTVNTGSNDMMKNLFQAIDEDGDDQDPWMDDARIQALYTLVR